MHDYYWSCFFLNFQYLFVFLSLDYILRLLGYASDVKKLLKRTEIQDLSDSAVR